MIIAIAAMALAATAAATTTIPPAPPTTVSVTTLPTQPTTTIGVTTTVPSGPTTTIPIPAGYTPLVDDTGVIVLAVPDTWQDVNLTPAMLDNEGTAVPSEGHPSIVASPDIQKFYTSFDVPGVSYFTVAYVEDPLTLLSQYGLTGGCTTMEVKEYDDPVFVGVIQIGTDCGPQHMTWNMVVASPADHSFTAVLQAQSADPDELKTLLLTFNVAN